MSNLIPFEGSTLPAHISQFEANADDLTAGVGQSYPVISIKGKVFHLVRGEERTLIKRPGEKGPAASLEVVILRANPHLSKVYYASGYTEGSDAKPDCYSNDGVKPAADAENPQAKNCATCPHNQWGSRITENGKKGKACADSRRIAVAVPGHINEPMLLRVPAASLKALAQFGDLLKKRGVPNYSLVVTEIGFDYSVAHPQLTFTPVAFADAKTAAEAAEMAKEEVVAQIVGLAPSARALEAGETVADVTDVVKPTAKPAGSTKAEQDEETAPAPAPAKAKKEPVVAAPLEDDILKGLAELGFDD